MAHSIAIYFTLDGAEPPPVVQAWIDARSLTMVVVRSPDDLMARTLRGRPRLVIFDGLGGSKSSVFESCTRLKRDSYTGIVPAVTLTHRG